MAYRCFVRTWLRDNPAHPNGLEPCPGPKYTLVRVPTEADARRIVSEWNATHAARRYGLRAGYEVMR